MINEKYPEIIKEETDINFIIRGMPSEPELEHIIFI